MGPCGLCREHRDLQDSHLIPKAFYKLARLEERKNPNPVVIFRSEAMTTSKQIKDYFLCQKCEDLLNKGGEAFVLNWCSRGIEKFKLGNLVKTLPTENTVEDWEIKDLSSAESKIAQKLSYFGASVFWRASAKKWPFQGKTIFPNSLGPYEEEFRLFLLGESGFPEHAELFVFVSSDSPVANYTFSPSKSNKSGKTHHKFCVPGIIFNLFVGKMVPRDTLGLGLAPQEATVAFGSFFQDEWFVKRLKESGEAKKRGSLGETS